MQIRNLQGLFAAKGIYSNWDRLGNIAAGVHYLQTIKKQVTTSIKSGYQGSTHTYVDTSALVWRIANKAWGLQLQKKVINREGNKWMKKVVDAVALGYMKMASSSLGTFNKKIAETKEGRATDTEVDDISLCRLAVPISTLDEEADERVEDAEISVLHEDSSM